MKKELAPTSKQEPVFLEDFEKIQLTVLFHFNFHKSVLLKFEERKLFLQCLCLG